MEPRRTKTRSELREALVSIFRAFDQATAEYSRLLLFRRFTALDVNDFHLRVVANACVQSSLINLRALQEFFRKSHKGLHPNTVRSTDFPGFVSPGAIMPPGDAQAINVYIAHITWDRKPDFEGHMMRRHIGAALDRMVHFLSYLRRDFLEFDDIELPVVVRLEQSLQAVRREMAVCGEDYPSTNG